MIDDFERCYRAVQSKDARFDGWFVTAVLTTKIYCRPSCPVRPPLKRNIRFLPSAAAAQHAGFRACKRCRPDASPGSPEWNLRTDVVSRAMRLIGDGVVDREGVTGLARRLGYSTRQLERHLNDEVGAGPLAVARAQRAQTARLLIETTDLPFAHIAFGSGFASIRQFNDTVRAVFDATPTAMRARASRAKFASAPAPGALSFRLPFRKPFAADALFGRLIGTGVPGVEEFRNGAYRRTMRLPNGTCIAELAPTPDYVACRLILDDVRDLTTAIARCRRLLDLDADPEAVDESLGADEFLAPHVSKRPGIRIRRTVDEIETAVRVVLGQQVSLSAARTHAGRIVAACGSPVTDPAGGLTHTFPTVEALAGFDTTTVKIPGARQRCLAGLIAALANGTVVLDAGADWNRARAQLLALGGIGPWTAEVIAMRALGDPDAFPSSDMGVLKAAAALGIADLAVHAAAWRPWRSYATHYLWSGSDDFGYFPEGQS
ncbi:MAG TPA: AlkA N-terminal domain-containing protein [Acidimicrobiales bacterium]|nr:AlkA N-terminal domain-containing protein [Acidimicrobiales bacterium]